MSGLTQLRQLPRHAYDLIWLKATIDARLFEHNLLLNPKHWLQQLDWLAAPEAVIAIVPHWQPGEETVCEFTSNVVESGYTIERIAGFNLLPNYPVTFVKKLR